MELWFILPSQAILGPGSSAGSKSWAPRLHLPELRGCTFLGFTKTSNVMQSGFLNSVAQSVRLLTSMSGVRASQGAWSDEPGASCDKLPVVQFSQDPFWANASSSGLMSSNRTHAHQRCALLRDARSSEMRREQRCDENRDAKRAEMRKEQSCEENRDAKKTEMRSPPLIWRPR